MNAKHTIVPVHLRTRPYVPKAYESPYSNMSGRGPSQFIPVSVLPLPWSCSIPKRKTTRSLDPDASWSCDTINEKSHDVQTFSFRQLLNITKTLRIAQLLDKTSLPVPTRITELHQTRPVLPRLSGSKQLSSKLKLRWKQRESPHRIARIWLGAGRQDDHCR